MFSYSVEITLNSSIDKSLLHLRRTQKCLQLPVLFFSFFPTLFQKRSGKRTFANGSQLMFIQDAFDT